MAAATRVGGTAPLHLWTKDPPPLQRLGSLRLAELGQRPALVFEFLRAGSLTGVPAGVLGADSGDLAIVTADRVGQHLLYALPAV